MNDLVKKAVERKKQNPISASKGKAKSDASSPQKEIPEVNHVDEGKEEDMVNFSRKRRDPRTLNTSGASG